MLNPNNLLITGLSTLLLAACQPSSAPDPQTAASETPQAAADRAVSPVESSPSISAGGKELDAATLQIVKGSVGISASAVACGMGTKARSDQGVARARAGFVERGFSGAAYDRAAADAYEETTAKFANASASEKAQACEQMKTFGEQMSQMGEDVQKMQKAGQ